MNEPWRTRELGDIVQLITESIHPPSQPSQEFVHHSLPAYDDVSGPIRQLGRSIQSNKTLVRAPAVLVSKLNPRIPRVSIVPNIPANEIHCASTEFMVYEPLSDQVDLKFLRYSFLSASMRTRLTAVATGTTGSHTRVNPRQTLRWDLDLPPIREQRKIAEILDTMDESIRSTERLIAKLRPIRIGLLQRLLTYGLTDTGYQPFDVGIIPGHWRVETLEELLAPVAPAMRSGPFGSALLKSELAEAGIPLLGIDNVHPERFVPRYSRFVSEQKYRELSRYTVYPRDVLVTIMGTVGRCCVAPSNIDIALSSKHLWCMTFDTSVYLPELICLQINYSPWVEKELQKDTQGGIMAAIRSETLKRIKLPVPPIGEQERILEILNAAKREIDTLSAQTMELKKVQQGLMEDLLTGRVRVKVD